MNIHCIVELGDLTTFSRDISDLFVKCFSQLSPQVPIISTLLVLIGRSDRVFPNLVLEKLLENLSFALEDDNIIVAKLNFRAIACLAAAGLIQLVGPDSFANVLLFLYEIVNKSIHSNNNMNDFNENLNAQAAAYLLSSTLPWIASALLADDLSGTAGEGLSLLTAIKDICQIIRDHWMCPFDIGGRLAMFHMNVCNTADSPIRGPEGAACWDELWCACDAAVSAAEDALNGLSSAPVCMCMLWLQFTDEDRLPDTEERDAMADDGDDAVKINTEDPPMEHPRIKLPQKSMAAIAAACHRIGVKPIETLCSEENRTPLNSHWLQARVPIFDLESAPTAESLMSLSVIQRHYLINTYSDILHFYEPIIRDDGTKVGSLELMCQHLISVNKLFPENNIKVEFALIELLLLRIIQVPPLRFPLTMRVILELCRIMPETASILATGLFSLFHLYI